MISLTVARGELLLVVADNGIGLDASRQAKPQAQQSAQLETGFGLFSVRERLALLGGSLALESGPDGTRARVRIPFGCEQLGNDVSDIADEG